MSELTLASAGDNIKLWDSNGFILQSQFSPHSQSVSSVAWSRDNQVLASASTAGDKVVLTYPGASSFTYSVAEKEKVVSVAFNASSRYVLAGSQTGAIHVWDLKTKSLKRSYLEHKKAVTAVQFNWNDSVIASGSESGEIILFNVVTSIASSPLIHNNAQAVRRVRYSHFKKSLIASCYDSGAVCLWDANKRQLMNSFSSHMAPVMDLAFSPLNEMLLMSVGLDKRIVCYDVQGKRPVNTMVAESPLTSLDLMHDGATLAVGTTRGKIFIYDLRQGTGPVKTITAHSGSIQALSFQYKLTKDDSGSKKSSASSVKKFPSTLHVVNDQTKVNGTTEVMTSLPNSILQQSNRENIFAATKTNTTADSVEIFSPVRERSFNRSNNNSLLRLANSPKSPAVNSTNNTPNAERNSSLNYADGLFSPLAHNSSKSPSGTRSQPIGGVDNVFTSYLAPQPEASIGMNDRDSTGDGAADTNVLNVTGRMNVIRRSHSPGYKEDSQQRPTGLQSNLTHEGLKGSGLQVPGTAVITTDHQQPVESSVGWPVGSSRGGVPTKESQTTPPEAAPSGGGGAGGGAEGGTSVAQPFQAEFIKRMIDSTLDDFREQVRDDILNLHVDMIKQFHIHQESTRLLLQQYSVNEDLLKEIQRLQEENKRLKKTF